MNKTDEISKKIIKDFKENVYEWLDRELDITIEDATIEDAHLSVLNSNFYYADIIIKDVTVYIKTLPSYILRINKCSEGVSLRVVLNIKDKNFKGD